jgi:DNA-binding PadR family transcriptional regulator
MALPALSPPLLVLASLADGPKHGYAMIEDIKEMTGVTLGAGTLYGAIAHLEESGFIQPLRPSDRRQPYRITAAGNRELRERAEAMASFAGAALRKLEAL